jgi:hypothetical protein
MTPFQVHHTRVPGQEPGGAVHAEGGLSGSIRRYPGQTGGSQGAPRLPARRPCLGSGARGIYTARVCVKKGLWVGRVQEIMAAMMHGLDDSSLNIQRECETRRGRLPN